MFSYIVHNEEAATRVRLGGKAGALAALRAADLPIPPWIVLAPQAFYDSLSSEEGRAFDQVGAAAEIRALLEGLQPGREVQDELERALAGLCPAGERVAVRSSAQEEDSDRHSFAGQLESFLSVSLEEVVNRVTDVWRSGFSERVLAYRRENGLPPLPGAPAVLIQRMVEADISGVAFGADPITGRSDVAVVGALYGLGTALVSGESDADTYRVDREGNILQREVAVKRTAHRCAADSPGGVQRVPVPEALASEPALSDAQVRAIAEMVRDTERVLGCPQDIEWAIEGDRILLLQSRPLTSLTRPTETDGRFALWDNSNIVESYAGITTPLTFSFARRAYEEVYRQFCRIMRVSAARVASHDEIFRQMLGLIRGRIYYNLLNWYRLLALLPGFAANRRFMEQMMGVKESLPDEIVHSLVPARWLDRLIDRLRLLGTLSGLLVNHFFLPLQIRRFHRRLESALGTHPASLERFRADELVAYYRNLERQLLSRWDAPLVNDFFAMIFFGLLRQLTARWCQDPEGALHSQLLSGEGGMISLEPVARLREMAQVAAKEPDLVNALCQAPLEPLLRILERAPEFHARYVDYLERFGDRCTDELKLENRTLSDDPLPLLRSIGQMARAAEVSAITIPSRPSDVTDLRREADQHVRGSLRRHPLRRLVFRWVLKHARARVRERENLRFERTRVFGRVRRIFRELGRRFHSFGLLDEHHDIFFLEVEEVLGFVEGTTSTTDLKGLVAVRQAEFERYHNLEAPADRFETRGIVHQGNPFQGNQGRETMDGDTRNGMGCCPGVVRGPAHIVTDPRNAQVPRGSVLVAERTDPGWILLFPFAAGLLVERGSLLSHSAIVAREMGLPTVVSLAGATRWLRDGDWVELDGSSGIVRKIASPSQSVTGCTDGL